MSLVLLFNLVFSTARSVACLFLHVPLRRDHVILCGFHVQVGVASHAALKSALTSWCFSVSKGLSGLHCWRACSLHWICPSFVPVPQTHFRELFAKVLTSTQPVKPPQYHKCYVTEAVCRKMYFESWSFSHQMRKMLMNWRRKMPLKQIIWGRHDQVPGGIPLP